MVYIAYLTSVQADQTKAKLAPTVGEDNIIGTKYNKFALWVFAHIYI